tara:strand:- start:1 stop:225 length:225 start_codon:yes stop_codon:yes gene_type:complete
MSDREIMDSKGYGRVSSPNPVQNQQLPDARKHQIISFIKSGVRILGYCFIPFSLVTATILLILSEIIGIVEELV